MFTQFNASKQSPSGEEEKHRTLLTMVTIFFLTTISPYYSIKGGEEGFEKSRHGGDGGTVYHAHDIFANEHLWQF